MKGFFLFYLVHRISRVKLIILALKTKVVCLTNGTQRMVMGMNYFAFSSCTEQKNLKL